MTGQTDNLEALEGLVAEGQTLFARSDFAGAGRLAQRCTALFPDEHDGPVLECRVLCAQGQWSEARELAVSLAGRDLTDPSHMHILIAILLGCGEVDTAYPLARKLAALDPGNIDAQRRLALTCRVAGKLDEAAEAANAVLKSDPHDYEFLALRSDVMKATAESNNIAELEALQAGGCKDQNGEIRVAFALAKELEEIGRFEQAFEVSSAGAALQRAMLNYSVDDDIQPFKALEQAFSSKEAAAATKGYASDEPIFILGLPRTGSTLIERILSSHSDVFSAGELQHFTKVLAEAIQLSGSVSGPLELMQTILKGDMGVLGRRYIDLTRPFTGATPRFIDKLPPNFVHLGFICLALPKAKIIHVRRTPLDACHAIYKFRFVNAYPWSDNLGEIATYYIAYRRLMDHWRGIFADRIIDIAYEDVVEDLEGEAKKLIAALDLPWQPACLDFHRNEAAATTGSASQVRQKIYSSSVGRWRNYENQLKPLANALEAAGIDPYAP